LSTPHNVLRADIRAPDFALSGKFCEPTDHSSRPTPEIEEPRASLETHSGRPKEIKHDLDMQTPAGEVFFGRAAITEPEFQWRNG